MLLALTLVALDAASADEASAACLAAVSAERGRVKEPVPLAPFVSDLLIDAPDPAVLSEGIGVEMNGRPVDWCLQPASGRRKRLLIADMDSTIVGCECLDELADFAGVKAEVAAVTERAMRGELAFEPALRERVARLKGLAVEAVARCRDERVHLNPGARTLVRTMTAHGARALLVSGGFESFTGPVAAAAGFHSHQGNRLLEAEGRLTGEVAEPILGREAKLAALHVAAGDLGLTLDECLAVGDGANDLAMIEAAGLGVAYRAKPVVAERADARVDFGDLTTLLFFQGYRAAEFAGEERNGSGVID
ncbi:phosphoserine phosphatase SerB [soil metagenome]